MDTIEKTKKAGPKRTGLLLIGSGGSLCMLATSPEPLAVLQVPLLAA